MSRRGGNGKSNWTPDRDARLRELRATDMTRHEMLERINDGYEPQVTMLQMQERARRIGAKRPRRIYAQFDYSQSGPKYCSDDAYRAMSDAFARAHREAGIRFRVVRFAVPPRRGIMSGPPPDLDRLIAAREQMARQSRHGVGEVFVRGLA